LASLVVPESGPARAGSRSPRRADVGRRAVAGWLLALVGVLALGALLAVVCHARPAYDAFGWLVWGHQALHWSLNLDGAPSWKPLTFIFTLPFSLFGHSAALWLWVITACAAAVGGPLMAGRLAWRLAPRGAGWMPPWLPPLVAAAVACGATATMTVAAKTTPLSMGLLRQVLIVTADPLAMLLWLGALDRHLSRRYGWALALLWLTALGRPESWVFLGGYALWLWLKVPRLRLCVVLALLSMPVAWFLAPGLASHSWLSAWKLDLGQPTAIHGNKVLGVLDRVRTLSGTAMQIEVAAAIVVVALRRHVAALALVGLAAVWTLVEVALALHGGSAVQRYMIEAGAPLAIVGGVGAAHALSWSSGRVGRLRMGLDLLGLAAVLAFLAALVPFAHDSVNGARAVISNQKLNAAEIDGLNRLMAKTGGAQRVLSCGAPAAALGWQSGVAWELGLDVGDVGFSPKSDYRSSPVVFFNRDGARWSISLLNPSAAARSRCSSLNGLSS
jgi:hypothetical protein